MGKDLTPRFAEPVTDWVKWFAWRPVATWDYGLVWFGFVYKRRCQPHDYLTGAGGWWWQYVKNPTPNILLERSTNE